MFLYKTLILNKMFFDLTKSQKTKKMKLLIELFNTKFFLLKLNF